MTRVILIHGWEGDPHQEWRPWLKSILENEGIEVIVPGMPDTLHPQMAPWVEKISETVGESGDQTYLVGHSLGCIAILRYLDSVNASVAIEGAVLVAGFGKNLHYSGYKGELDSFFSSPLDWERIRGNCLRFVSIHSDNDTFVDISNSKLFKEKLGAESLIEHNMGHFSGSDGILELPIVYNKLVELIK